VPPLPHQRPSALTNIEKGENAMERNNSLSLKPRCHEKLVWELADFCLDEKIFGGLLSIPESKIYKKKVRALLAPPLTPTTLFTIPA
jgi:hypothetical protein